jgi:RNA polymerase sigma-70 factor, ECF subfamily
MTQTDQHHITRLLSLAAAGDPAAANDLYEALYADLHNLAATLLAQERPGISVTATSLVSEAYLRLRDPDQPWESRRHFFGAAARAMQRILIERARRRRSVPITLGDHDAQVVESDVDWESLSAALDTLHQRDPRMHEVVMLRFFAGQSVENTAQLMGISERLVVKEWHFARAWLYRAIRGTPEPG